MNVLLPRALALVAVLASLGISAASLISIRLGDSANSRLATAYSLVHYGSWYIDATPSQPNIFEAGTVDKVELDGRTLSTKPPVLPLMLAAEYVVLHHGFGLRLDVREQARFIVRFMVLTLLLFPLAIGFLTFWLSARLLRIGEWSSAFLVAALALGTQIPGFAGHINNHTPAVAFLCIAAWCTLRLLLKPPARVAPWLFGFGICGGLVFTLDLPETIYIAALGLALLWRMPAPAIVWGGLGMALPLGVHFAAMMLSTGSPLPIQLHEDWYLYESAYWRNPGGVDALNEPAGTYLWHMTFGRYGTFALFPVLALGLAGFAFSLRKPLDIQRAVALCGGAAFAILTAYYVLKTNNYGGVAYGFRWHLASAPVLLLMAAPFLSRMRSRNWSAPLLLLLGVSAYSAWECWREPWSKDLEWTVRLIWGPPV